jgi:hypothetical protein
MLKSFKTIYFPFYSWKKVLRLTCFFLAILVFYNSLLFVPLSFLAIFLFAFSKERVFWRKDTAKENISLLYSDRSFYIKSWSYQGLLFQWDLKIVNSRFEEGKWLIIAKISESEIIHKESFDKQIEITIQPKKVFLLKNLLLPGDLISSRYIYGYFIGGGSVTWKIKS